MNRDQSPSEDVFDENTDFLDKSRHEDHIDSELWEDLFGCEAHEQVFDQTVEFVDLGRHDESGLCEDLLYGDLK